MKEKIIFKQNKLKKIAEEIFLAATQPEEIMKENMTEIFKDELKQMPENGELINMTINAQVTSGKSVLSMAIVQYILKHVFNKEMGMKHVLRDQYELMKFQKENRKDTCIQIDEWDDMEESGENSTLTKKLRDQMSKVQAQRFIHKVSCSPDDSNDILSDIVLEVIQKNTKHKVTRSKLFIKILHGGQWHLILVGYVDFSVRNILNKKWYENYRRRKFEKMELITKHGVFKPRDLEYAELQLTVIKKLKGMAKIGLLTTKSSDTIMNILEIESRKQKLEFSMLGTASYIKRIDGVLSQYGKIKTIKTKLNQIENALLKNPEDYYLKEEKKELIEEIDIVGEVINSQIKELNRLIEIKKEYEKI